MKIIKTSWTSWKNTQLIVYNFFVSKPFYVKICGFRLSYRYMNIFLIHWNRTNHDAANGIDLKIGLVMSKSTYEQCKVLLDLVSSVIFYIVKPCSYTIKRRSAQQTELSRKEWPTVYTHAEREYVTTPHGSWPASRQAARGYAKWYFFQCEPVLSTEWIDKVSVFNLKMLIT